MIRSLLILMTALLINAAPTKARELWIDPKGAYFAFAAEKGWGEPPTTVDTAVIEQIRAGHGSTDPAAVERLIEALETTYFGFEIGGLTAPTGAYGVTYLADGERIVLIRFFLNTVRATDLEGAEFFDLVERVVDEDLWENGGEVLEDVWGAYIDPDKRQFDHGWVSLSGQKNRAMAWGVPPDFIEIVVTARTDCEFLPVQGWFPRQLCP